MISASEFLKRVRATLLEYLDIFPEEAEHLITFLDFLTDDGRDIGSRKNMNGHMCANMVILDETKSKILLIYHNFLQKWLTPGGHFDYNDGSLKETALREAKEETGLYSIKEYEWTDWPWTPLHIDFHPIPANVAKNEGEHRHFVFYYLGQASSLDQPIIALDEVSQIKWFGFDEIEEPETLKIVEKIKQILKT